MENQLIADEFYSITVVQVKCPETNYWSESRYVREADNNNVDDGYVSSQVFFATDLYFFSGGVFVSVDGVCIQEDGYRDDVTANITLGNVDGGRSEGFAAIFLITLFLGLSLGLAVYAG